MEAASDYRLNYRLAKACKADVAVLCSGACSAEQGQVRGVCGGREMQEGAIQRYNSSRGGGQGGAQDLSGGREKIQGRGA